MMYFYCLVFNILIGFKHKYWKQKREIQIKKNPNFFLGSLLYVKYHLSSKLKIKKINIS